MTGGAHSAKGRVAYEAYGREIIRALAADARLQGWEPDTALCPWDELTVTVRTAWTIAAEAVLTGSAAGSAVGHSRVIVHVLQGGFALCGVEGVPGDWPDGHKWVSLQDIADATCVTCLSRALD